MASSYPLPNRIFSPGRTAQRPALPSTQTVVSTSAVLQTPERRGYGRSRATTDFRPPITVNFSDRQTRPHHPAPLHIDLAPTIERSDHFTSNNNQDSASLPVPFNHTPSDPIPIPSRRISLSQPTTPLTARVGTDSYFPSDYYITPRKAHFSSSLRGEDQSQNRRPNNSVEQSPPVAQHRSPAIPVNMRPGQDTPMYTPSSPLSPTMPAPPVPSALHARANGRRAPPAPNLRLSSLPRFHPANFPLNDSPSSASPRISSRHQSAQYTPRRLSAAQVKLQQYQRDLIAIAARSSRAVISPTAGVKPSPPRLHPLGSPGPVTPMMLEGQGDYLLAGTGGVNSKMSPVMDGREMVEKMIQQENERRNYPGREERISPAVSPAGGRG